MKPSDKFHLMVVGDVHGHYPEYLETIRLANYSLQLGDLGLNYAPLIKSGLWHPDKHKFVPGNHDNYTIKEVHNLKPNDNQVLNPYNKYVVNNNRVYTYTNLPDNCLGNYGLWKVPEIDSEAKQDFIFFIRGAWSIDFSFRTPGVDIWENEELTDEEFNRAIDLYEKTKPSIVVSHACPLLIEAKFKFTRWVPSKTCRYLQKMLDVHTPDIWLFGHYHHPFDSVIYQCRFICLGELEFFCFDNKLNPLS